MQAQQAIKETKPFLDALSGIKTDRPPFWFMRQAGRYLPEYRQLRAKKGGFLEMAFDPDAACEITMQPIRRFQMDAAIIFSDILTIPMALGQDLEFVAGEGPKLGDLDINALNMDAFEKLNPVYEAITKTKTALLAEGYDQTALIGFAGAPWTVATYMIEGGSSKDFMKTKVLAYHEPEKLDALIEILIESTAQYLINQIKAGAEVVKIFDSWAGVLDADEFEKWSVEPARKIVEKIHETYPNIPIIGFPKGAGYKYISYAKKTGITAIAVDQHVPPGWIAENLQPLMPVQGNLDPFALMAGGKALEMSAEKIIEELENGPFIFNLGHGVHKDTSVEHVERLVEIIRGDE